MASLLDIGPLTEDVEIRGTKLTVQGLTAGHLFQLFAEFPEMRKLLQMGEGSPQEVMLQLAPDLIAKIIAIATGTPGNSEVEAKAKTMGASDQLAVIAAVQRLSFPDGLGPFVERVTQLMGSAVATLPGAVLPNSANSTMKSPAPFNASLQLDTPNPLSGRARRDN